MSLTLLAMATSQPPNCCNSEVPISMATSMATGGAMGFHPSVAEGCAETPSKHLSQVCNNNL